MRSPDTPDPVPPSSSRLPAEPSGLVPLQPTNPDDAPTVIKTNRPQPPSDPSLGLVAGNKLGHFELIEAIGAGGMAAVLKARDLDLNRVVALKILPPHMARDPENVTRFKHEARAAAKLDHDNIARVFFCGEDQGLHFIAFEFVEGDTLRTLIERRGPLATAECIRYIAQVAAGLAHAAERGVVHRDIKPSNIMITPDGKAKIVDMGLAKQLAHSVNGGVTQSGVTLGTFDYISPEQALDPRRADVRSDLYSLGCAFYHALTGRSPVPEGTAAKKLRAHQSEPITDPRVLNTAIPDEMAAILAKMMAKDPAKRYQTPAELIAALSALARQLNLSPDAIAVDPALLPADPSSVRLLSEPPRIPISLIAGFAILVVAIAVMIAMSGPGRAPSKPEWDVVTPGTKAAIEQPPVGGAPAVPPATVGVAANELDLIRLLEDSRITEIHLEAGRLYDLSQTKGVAVTAAGRTLTVDVQQVPGKSEPPTLRLAAVAPDGATNAVRAGSLTLAKFASVRFRGIRFEIAESPMFEEPGTRSLGLVLADAGSVELTECRFVAHPNLEAADIAGVAIHRDLKEPGHTTAKLAHCYFGLRRGAAVQLVGFIKADVSESGFAPHPVAFQLDDPTDDAIAPEIASELTLRHCTFLLDKGTVAEAEDGVRWRVSAGYCVFAAAPPTPAEAMAMVPERPERRSALVRTTGVRTDAVRFTASPNEPNATFRTDVPADAEVIDLKQQAPWELADPLAALDSSTPWAALRLKTTILQLRRPGAVGIVGVRRLPTELARIYPTWPLPSATATGPVARVWWPEVKALDPEKRPPNTYETWGEAVAALRAGDELQVRSDGDLAVAEEQFAKKFPVTVRPFPGSRPVLVLDPGERTEPTLFKLMEGELTLDGLEFRIKVKPMPPGEVRTASVVTLVGGKNCTLRNCVVTLEEQADEKAAAVVLADPTGVMQSAADRRPEVRLHRCLIRGKGRGVWVASARPFDLDLTHTVTALAGPVVAVDPAAKPPAAGASARVRFDHVTALLAGPLLELRPSRATPGTKPGWVPVAVESERSLFAPVERGFPLMLIDGGDAAMYGTTFTWGGSANWYGNFGETGTYLEATTDVPGEPKKLAADEWFTLTGEKADATGLVRFAKNPRSARPATMLAEHLAVRAGAPADTGADVRQVAKPDAER